MKRKRRKKKKEKVTAFVPIVPSKPLGTWLLIRIRPTRSCPPFLALKPTFWSTNHVWIGGTSFASNEWFRWRRTRTPISSFFLSFFLLYSFFMYILLKGMYSRFGCGGYREMDHQIQKKRSSHHKQVNERYKTYTFSLILWSFIIIFLWIIYIYLLLTFFSKKVLREAFFSSFFLNFFLTSFFNILSH